MISLQLFNIHSTNRRLDRVAINRTSIDIDIQDYLNCIIRNSEIKHLCKHYFKQNFYYHFCASTLRFYILTRN